MRFLFEIFVAVLVLSGLWVASGALLCVRDDLSPLACLTTALAAM